MWILHLELESGETNTRALFRGQTYEIGRDTAQISDTLIRIDKVYISKRHLSIELADVDRYSTYRTPLRIGVLSRASTVINGKKYKLSAGQDPVFHTFTDNMTMTFKNDLERITLKWQEVRALETEELDSQFSDADWDIRLTKTINDATHYIGPQEGLTYAAAIAYNLPVVDPVWLDETDWDIKKYETSYERPSKLLNDTIVVQLEQDSHHKDFLETVISQLGGELAQVASVDDIVDFLRPKLKQSLVFSDQPSTTLTQFAADHGSELLGTSGLVQMMVNGKQHLQYLKIPVKREPESQMTETQASQPSSRRRKRFKKAGLMDFFDFASSSQLPPPDESLDVPVSSPVKETPSELPEPPAAEPHKEVADSQPVTVTVKQEPDSIWVTQSSQEQAVEEPVTPVEKSPSNEPEPTKDSSPVKPPARKHALERSNEDHEFKRPHKIKPQVSFYDAVKTAKAKATEQIKEELGLEGTNEDVESKLSNLVIVETVEIKMKPKVEKKSSPLKSAYAKKNFKNFKKNIKLKSKITRSFIDVQDIPSVRQPVMEGTVSEYDDPEEKMAHDFDGLLDEVAGYDPNRDQLTQYQEEEEQFSFRGGNGLFVDEDSQPSQVAVTKPASKRKAKSKPSRTSSRASIDIEDDDDDDMPAFSFSRRR